MIALLKNGLTDERKELVHERFLAMLPRIRRQALVAFWKFRSEVREELVQEVVANCYRTWVLLVRRGKESVAYATPLAQYAIRQVRDGRRVGGRLNATRYNVSLREQATRFQDRAARSKGSADWSLERAASRGSPRRGRPKSRPALGSNRLVALVIATKSSHCTVFGAGRDDQRRGQAIRAERRQGQPITRVATSALGAVSG